MVEVVVARNALAEVGRTLFALPEMVTSVVRNGRTETQACVQLELTPQGTVRVRALVSEPLASQLEQQASVVLAQVLARMQ